MCELPWAAGRAMLQRIAQVGTEIWVAPPGEAASAPRYTKRCVCPVQVAQFRLGDRFGKWQHSFLANGRALALRPD